MNYAQPPKESHHAMTLAQSHLDDAIMQLGRVARHAEVTPIGAVALDLQAQVVAFTQRPLINAIAHSQSADLLLRSQPDAGEGQAVSGEVAAEVDLLGAEMSVETRTAFVLAYLSIKRAYHLLRLINGSVSRAQIVLRVSRYRALLIAK
jgi:hypothetical protein